MKKTLIAGAVTAAITLALTGCEGGTDAPTEKCYGIAKAGKNDCAAGPGTSCQGSSTKDGEEDAWMLVMKGNCEKIVGGIPETNNNEE